MAFALQAATHCIHSEQIPQARQRLASFTATSSEKPSSISLNPETLSSIGMLGIFALGSLVLPKGTKLTLDGSLSSMALPSLRSWWLRYRMIDSADFAPAATASIAIQGPV